VFKKIFNFIFPNGFKFRVKKDWPGEKDLPYPNREPDVTDKTIEKEIVGSLKKEARHG